MLSLTEPLSMNRQSTSDSADIALREPPVKQSNESCMSSVIHHVGILPSSILLMDPELLLSALIVVLPDQVLEELKLIDNQYVKINDRIALLRAVQSLLPATFENHSDRIFPPVALLSPCLYQALRDTQDEVASVVVKALEEVPSIESVCVTPLLPHPWPVEEAAKLSILTKNALIGRQVQRGDVFPVNLSIWIVVDKVVGHGVVLVDTNFAFVLRTKPSLSLGMIEEPVRAWALTKWGRPLVWDSDPYSRQVAHALNLGSGIVLIEGLLRDAEDVVRSISVGRLVKWSRWDSDMKLKESIARCELSGCGVVVLEDISEEVVSVMRSYVAQREGPCSHLHESKAIPKVCFLVICENRDDLSRNLLEMVEVDVCLSSASYEERETIFKDFKHPTRHKCVESEMQELVRMSTGFARREVCGLGEVYSRAGIEGCRESVDYFEKGKLTIDAGNVTWEDIGGLDGAREQIVELVNIQECTPEHSITSYSQHDSFSNEVKEVSNRRVGVLLYGPPGTGKTLLARAVAGECGCSFIAVKGPELLDMYVGESEKNVRKVFERAVAGAPCVLFFDELDALAPSRGKSSDSGGVLDRVVSQLLAELDAISLRPDVFIIAATNRPDLVDAGLLRPGRLDKMIYVPMPKTRKDQAKILKAQTRKFRFTDGIDVEQALSHAPNPPQLSGADIYSLASSSWMLAAKRAIKQKSSEIAAAEETEESGFEKLSNMINYRGAETISLLNSYRMCFHEYDHGKGVTRKSEVSETFEPDRNHNEVLVSQEDLVSAAKSLIPSLSESRLREYDKLRERLESGI